MLQQILLQLLLVETFSHSIIENYKTFLLHLHFSLHQGNLQEKLNNDFHSSEVQLHYLMKTRNAVELLIPLIPAD